MTRAIPTLFGLVILLGACAAESPDLGVSGPAPVPTVVEPTTTTSAPTTTTLPVAVSTIPDVSDLDLVWDEPEVVDPITGEIDMGPFNRFIVGNPNDLATGAPNLMVPAGSFDGLGDDATETAMEQATDLAPARAVAVYLGLDPDDAGVQLLSGPAGGPEAVRIIVIENVDGDDSTRALRWEFVVQLQDKAGFASADEAVSQAEGGLEGDASEEAVSDCESQVTPEGAQEECDTQEPGDEDPAASIIPIINSGYRTSQCQPARGHQDFVTGDCL